MPEVVYVGRLRAVSDHDIIGVFTSLDALVEHAAAVIRDSDKHHEVVVDEVRLDHGYLPKWRWHPDRVGAPYEVDETKEVGWVDIKGEFVPSAHLHSKDA